MFDIGFYKTRQAKWRRVFSGEGLEVLKDLSNACYVNTSIMSDSERQDAYKEGRRSVYLYIQNILKQDLSKLIEQGETEL